MVKSAKISVAQGSEPYRFRLSEAEASKLLQGKSVLITSSVHMKGGKLRKDQEHVDLYLPKAVVESCSRKGDDWTVKVKFPDPDQDPTVLHYLDENQHVQGGSFFRKLWRGLKKAGKFMWKVAKKVAPPLLEAVQPVLNSFVKGTVESVPGLPGLIESGKKVISNFPGGASAVSAIEGGVGKVLGSGLSSKQAEARANQVLKAMKPVLVQSFMTGGRLVAV